MPKGAAESIGSSGEVISHFNGVRIRVNGTGMLKLKLYGLDDVLSQNLSSINMANSPGLSPLVKSNFKNQRASLELKTTEINEIFKINRIIVFSKPLWATYPGQ